MFIVLEGPEFTGKTTLLNSLVPYLQQKFPDREIVATVAPGGTPLGQKLRHLLLHQDLNISPVSELMMFVADLNQLIQTVILPALARGAIVITDRYVYSTVAYQRDGREILGDNLVDGSIDSILDLRAEPDIIFHLDISIEEMKARMIKYGSLDRIERESDDFWERVITSFRQQFSDDARVCTLNEPTVTAAYERAVAHLDRHCADRHLE
jgi:dTMP kinase